MRFAEDDQVEDRETGAQGTIEKIGGVFGLVLVRWDEHGLQEVDPDDITLVRRAYAASS